MKIGAVYGSRNNTHDTSELTWVYAKINMEKYLSNERDNTGMWLLFINSILHITHNNSHMQNIEINNLQNCLSDISIMKYY